MVVRTCIKKDQTLHFRQVAAHIGVSCSHRAEITGTNAVKKAQKESGAKGGNQESWDRRQELKVDLVAFHQDVDCVQGRQQTDL